MYTTLAQYIFPFQEVSSFLRMYDTVRHKNAKIYVLCSDSATISPIVMFHTATVRPRRSGPRILYNTPLRRPLRNVRDEISKYKNTWCLGLRLLEEVLTTWNGKMSGATVMPFHFFQCDAYAGDFCGTRPFSCCGKAMCQATYDNRPCPRHAYHTDCTCVP